VRAPFLAVAAVFIGVGCSNTGDGSDTDAGSVLATPASAATHSTVRLREDKPGLLARAKLTPDQARALALARVPGGRILDGEIEEEDGRLVYSFDLAVDGQPGVMDVEIDAMTGEVLAAEPDDEEDGEDADDTEDDEEHQARQAR
jgi:uncharacterized membrane protein YkoI